MAARHHTFILAGTGSGCGKTTVTLGLLRLLQKRARRVQPFKVGPDYLDTGWHTAFCGVASRNLDGFMLPPPVLNALFCDQMQQADIAVIEGGMGLYDGYGVDSNYCSTAAMAIYLSVQRIHRVAERLIAGGYPVTTPVVVIYKATWPESQTVRGTLADISDKVRDAGIRKTALILVGNFLGKEYHYSRLYTADFSHEYRKA